MKCRGGAPDSPAFIVPCSPPASISRYRIHGIADGDFARGDHLAIGGGITVDVPLDALAQCRGQRLNLARIGLVLGAYLAKLTVGG